MDIVNDETIVRNDHVASSVSIGKSSILSRLLDLETTKYNLLNEMGKLDTEFLESHLLLMEKEIAFLKQKNKASNRENAVSATIDFSTIYTQKSTEVMINGMNSDKKLKENNSILKTDNSLDKLNSENKVYVVEESELMEHKYFIDKLDSVERSGEKAPIDLFPTTSETKMSIEMQTKILSVSGSPVGLNPHKKNLVTAFENEAVKRTTEKHQQPTPNDMKILEFCIIEADWSHFSKEKQLAQKYPNCLTPLLPSIQKYRFPGDSLSDEAHILDQNFFFPSGVKVELLPPSRVEFNTKSQNYERHIVQFSRDDGVPSFACCLTVMQAYNTSKIEKTESNIIPCLMIINKMHHAARCLQKVYRHYRLYRRQLDWMYASCSLDVTPLAATRSSSLHDETSINGFTRMPSKLQRSSTLTKSIEQSINFSNASSSDGDPSSNVLKTTTLEGAITLHNKTENFSDNLTRSNDSFTYERQYSVGGTDKQTVSPQQVPAINKPTGPTSTFFSTLFGSNRSNIKLRNGPVDSEEILGHQTQGKTFRLGRSSAPPASSNSVHFGFNELPLNENGTNPNAITKVDEERSPLDTRHSDSSPLFADKLNELQSKDHGDLIMEKMKTKSLLEEDNTPTEVESEPEVELDHLPPLQVPGAKNPQTEPNDPEHSSQLAIMQAYLRNRIVVAQKAYCILSPIPEYTFIFKVLERIAEAESLFHEKNIPELISHRQQNTQAVDHATRSYSTGAGDSENNFQISRSIDSVERDDNKQSSSTLADSYLKLLSTPGSSLRNIDEKDSSSLGGCSSIHSFPLSMYESFNQSNESFIEQSGDDDEDKSEQLLLEKREHFLNQIESYMHERFNRPFFHIQDLSTNFTIPTAARSFTSNKILQKYINMSIENEIKASLTEKPRAVHANSQSTAVNSNFIHAYQYEYRRGLVQYQNLLPNRLSLMNTNRTSRPDSVAWDTDRIVDYLDFDGTTPRRPNYDYRFSRRRYSTDLTANDVSSQHAVQHPDKRDKANTTFFTAGYIEFFSVDTDALLSTKEWAFAVMLAHLNSLIIFKIINLLLMEKSLIIYGKNAGIVTSITLAAYQLISPFVWVGIFVPLVPDNARELFGAPVPLILGTTSPPRLDDVSNSTAVLYLNDDSISIQRQKKNIQKKTSISTVDLSGSKAVQSKTKKSLSKFARVDSVNHGNREATKTPYVEIHSTSGHNRTELSGSFSSLSGGSPLGTSNTTNTQNEIEFSSWFVRLPEVTADMPLDDELSKRADYVRKLICAHYAEAILTRNKKLNPPMNGTQLRRKGMLDSSKDNTETLSKNSVLKIKNNFDMLLMTNVPEEILRHIRVLMASLKRYNFRFCGNQILDTALWKRCFKYNVKTGNSEFTADCYMEPLRNQLEFQDAIVRTQLFISFFDRLQAEHEMLNNIRKFISHWIYFRILIRRKKRIPKPIVKISKIRPSIMLNDDDYDYAIELCRDDEYRQAAESLPHIVDFEDLERVIPTTNYYDDIDEENARRYSLMDGEVESKSSQDELDDFYDMSKLELNRRESKFDQLMMDHVRNTRNSITYKPFQNTNYGNVDSLKANPNIDLNMSLESSVHSNLETDTTSDGKKGWIISKKEFLFRINALENHKKWVEKAARRSSLGLQHPSFKNEKDVMDKFLVLMAGGVLIRRHQSNHYAEIVKLFSTKGCRTIRWEKPSRNDLKEVKRRQKKKFNSLYETKLKIKNITPKNRDQLNEFSYDNSMFDCCIPICGCGDNAVHSSPKMTHKTRTSIEIAQTQLNLSVDSPDTVEEMSEKQRTTPFFFCKSCFNWRYKLKGYFKDLDIIAVHPANAKDPTDLSKLGTDTLRNSSDEFNPDLTFSLILRDEMNSLAYSSLDIECDSVELYQTMIRGFKKLKEDIDFSRRRSLDSTDNFSVDFKFRLNQVIQTWNGARKKLFPPEDELPIDRLNQIYAPRHFLNNFGLPLYNHNALNMNQNSHTNIPPARFLGWKSAGTQIWARLKMAGLDVKCVFSWDLQRVILKVRCPTWRLEQMAEQMHLKIKSKDGYMKQFKVHRRDTFVALGANGGIFRSSERQQIIDYILRSKIKDGGTELDENTELGRKIVQRFPLHMYSRLVDIRQVWITFWKKESFGEIPPAWSPFSSSYAQTFQNITESIKYSYQNILTQPLDQIAEYFGENIAFYFAYLAFYSRWLIFPSVLGIIVFCFQFHDGTLDHWLCVPYSVVVLIWACFMLAFWRQRSSCLAYKWGVIDHEIQETERPQFRGFYFYDENSGEIRKTYSLWKRLAKYFVSVPVLIAAIATTLVIMCTVFHTQDVLYVEYLSGESLNYRPSFPDLSSLFSISKAQQVVHSYSITKTFVNGSSNSTSTQYFTDYTMAWSHHITIHDIKSSTFWSVTFFYPCLYGILIALMTTTFRFVAIWLNDYENHRTETTYMNRLILKVFSYEFVTVFTPIFYYAFFTGSAEGAYTRMSITIFSLMTVGQWWQVVLDLCIPALFQRAFLFQMRANYSNTNKIIYNAMNHAKKEINGSDVENTNILESKVNKRFKLLNDAKMKCWEESLQAKYSSFTDYTSMIIQICFVLFFSFVFPLTPLIALLNNIILIRLNALKICYIYQRPVALRISGIGVWENVLQVMSIGAVLANCAILGVTSNQLSEHLSSIGKTGITILLFVYEQAILFFKYWLHNSVPAISPAVQRAQTRERRSMDRVGALTLQPTKKESIASIGRKSILKTSTIIYSTISSGSSSDDNIDTPLHQTSNKQYDNDSQICSKKDSLELNAKEAKSTQITSSMNNFSDFQVDESNSNCVSTPVRSVSSLEESDEDLPPPSPSKYEDYEYYHENVEALTEMNLPLNQKLIYNYEQKPYTLSSPHVNNIELNNLHFKSEKIRKNTKVSFENCVPPDNLRVDQIINQNRYYNKQKLDNPSYTIKKEYVLKDSQSNFAGFKEKDVFPVIPKQKKEIIHNTETKNNFVRLQIPILPRFSRSTTSKRKQALVITPLRAIVNKEKNQDKAIPKNNHQSNTEERKRIEAHLAEFMLKNKSDEQHSDLEIKQRIENIDRATQLVSPTTTKIISPFSKLVNKELNANTENQSFRANAHNAQVDAEPPTQQSSTTID